MSNSIPTTSEPVGFLERAIRAKAKKEFEANAANAKRQLQNSGVAGVWGVRVTADEFVEKCGNVGSNALHVSTILDLVFEKCWKAESANLYDNQVSTMMAQFAELSAMMNANQEQ